MRDRDLSASLSSSSVGGHSRAAQVTKKFSKLILRWRLLTWSLCALEDMQLMSRSSSDHRLVAEAVWLQKKKTTVKNATKSKCRIVEHNRTDFLHHLHLDLQIPRCTLSYNFSIMTSSKNNTSLDTFPYSGHFPKTFYPWLLNTTTTRSSSIWSNSRIQMRRNTHNTISIGRAFSILGH